MSERRFRQDPGRPCFVISVAASLVHAHPRTLRIYEDEGLLAPARTPTNIRLYSENDIRRILWIRRLTQERGVNLAGVRLLFELEERLNTRILEALFDEGQARDAASAIGIGTADEQEETTRQDTGAASREPLTDFAAQDRPGPSERPVSAGRGPITRIVATRVATTRSGDSND
jgi:MerR family transcriptional regulator, heat shock protein HspR